MTTPITTSAARVTQRLSLLQSSSLRPAQTAPSGGARDPDSATLSDTGRRLGEVSAALDAIKQAFASAKVNGIASAQDELDAARALFESLVSKLNRSGGYHVDDVSPQISNASFYASGVQPGEEIPLDVEVTRFAEPAEFFVHIPGGTIDLTAQSALTIQIVGNLGAKTFGFASGQTLGQIVSVINAFTAQTGLVAETVPSIGSGFVLRSVEFGAGEYASVRNVSGGSNVLIGQVTDPLDPTSAQLNPLDLYHFSIEDYGRDADVTINGHAPRMYTTYGNHIAFAYSEPGSPRYFSGMFDLPPYTVGSFTAATIRGTYAEQRG